MILTSPVPWVLLAVALILSRLVHQQATKPKHPFPPGPKGLSLIGNLLDINNERPWITYSDWCKQHGDIVMFWVMGKPTILLGKMQHAHALLQKRMINYGDRPQLVMAQEFVTQNGWYIGTSRTIHGTHKKQRKILAERLRAKALKDWAHPAVLPESRLFLQRLVRTPDRFIDIIKCFTVNVMLRTTFGQESMSNLDNPLMRRINEVTDHQFISQVQGRFWVDYFPFLKDLPSWLPGMAWKKTGLNWRKEADTLFDELWEGTKNRSQTQGHPSLVQTLIETQMDQISHLEGTTISAAMVDAGTETLTGTTVTFLIIFMYFPEVLKKAQQVIDEAIGRDRLPNFEDVTRIPYITAMIREAFRWRTVAPVAIPHAVVQDDFYEGYFIPKGTTVFALSHYMHQDPELYPNPDQFMPERFLNEKGELNDLPHAGFGFGSRKCLGQHFAEQTLFLLISSIVWAFDCEPVVDKNGKNILPSLDPMDWGAFLASPPPMDFDMVIKPRFDSVTGIVDQVVEAGS